MSSATANFFNEPEERIDPRERLLDAFDAMLDALVDNDLEAQMRARFVAKFPPARPEPDLFAPGDSPPGSRPPGAGITPDEELELLALVDAMKRAAGWKMPAHAHNAVARLRARAEAELSAAKQARAA